MSNLEAQKSPSGPDNYRGLIINLCVTFMIKIYMLVSCH